MEGKKYSIITIGREYCAGGTSVAERLSKKLGIPWYDRDFAALTAKNSGYTLDEVLEEGEELSEFSRFLNSFLNNATSYTSSFDEIYKAQKEALLMLQKPCIVIGRCSNLIYKEEGVDSFDIFLYADEDVRLKRAKERDGEDIDIKDIEKKDSKRENYYKNYTKHELADCRDYNICLDTGAMDYDECAELLANILKDRIAR